MASTRRDDPRAKDIIPDVIIDDKMRKRYLKGKFLGKGGFAKCFELIDEETKEIFAGKIVPKALLTKQQQRDKMTQEIEIQRSLQHKHVVKFFSFFEDQHNVYIILELCRRRSLMELHKRRKAVTEPETRYFLKQLLSACIYLHDKNIIHRDLKLGNLFLNDEMELKIGDFGLATRVEYNGERKRTLCGTPNYIAPEVLCKKGHSFEVDVWSLGCILYTLLCGKPPFETSNLKETYGRIRRNEYHFPSRIPLSVSARNLVQALLQRTHIFNISVHQSPAGDVCVAGDKKNILYFEPRSSAAGYICFNPRSFTHWQSDPSLRPTMHQIIEHDFLTTGYLPPALPTSCLTMAPRFDAMPKMDARRPLSTLNGEQVNAALLGETEKLRKLAVGGEDKPDVGIKRNADDPDDYWISDLHQQIIRVTQAKQPERICIDDSEDPACVPIYWVCKWVDYSDKYGLGYQLCDNSIGVLFNDSTRLLLTGNGENIQYIERDFTEHLHTLKHYPESLTKKVTLLKYFRNYMSEHLLKAGANMVPRQGDEMIRLPFLRTWFRTRSAIILHLSNGTIQINFFQDHTKVILCPLMGAVSFIDQKREFRTFRLSLIEKYGSSRDLASRLRYARNMIERLMSSLTKSGGGATGTSSTKSLGAGSVLGPAQAVVMPPPKAI